MKKFALICFLIFSYSYAYAKPPYESLYDLGVNIITSKHPTSFEEIKYIGEENRNMVIGGWPIEKRQAHVFHAFYNNRSISDPLAQGNGLIVHLPDRGKFKKISPQISPAEKECAAHHCTEILVYYHKPKINNLKRAKNIAKRYAVALGQTPNILQRHLLDGIHIFGRPSSLDEIGGTNAQTWRKTIYIREESEVNRYFF